MTTAAVQDHWKKLRKQFEKSQRKLRKKHFKYSDQLTFLLPIIEKEENLSSKSATEDSLLTEFKCEPSKEYSDTNADPNSIPDFSSASYTQGVGYILDNFSPSNIESIKSYSVDQTETTCDSQDNDSSNHSAESNENVKEHLNADESYVKRMRISEENETESVKGNFSFNSQCKKEIDEDKVFLLSLLPDFKKFDNITKLDLKTDILRAIRNKLAQKQQNIGST